MVIIASFSSIPRAELRRKSASDVEFLPACPQFMMAFILGSQESRSMLRRLDRVIGFPEEGALMLRDFEHALFGGTNVKQLLQGLVKNLAKRKGQSSHRKKEQNVLHFHRIVAHFYLVS